MSCTQQTNDLVSKVVLHALDGETLPPLKLHNLINAVAGLVEKENNIVYNQGKQETLKKLESILGYCGSWDKADIVECKKKDGRGVGMRVDVLLDSFK